MLISGTVNGINDAKKSQNKSDTLSPIEILQQRYARGEIDRNEYEEKKRVLSN
jgi:uncharacterized membrane protein